MENVQKTKIELNQVSKTFTSAQGDIFALKNISFKLEENQFISIVGPSGCGKSTLFNLITCLLTQDSGEILLEGLPVTKNQIAEKVSYMPQKDLLLPWRKILDNVIIGLEIKGVKKSAARKQALELMPLFGLSGFENNYPDELSGGMKQRAALLRTFLGNRDILLLDEPFGKLDAITRFKMQLWLMDIWEQFKSSVLFITHDIDEAILLSDKVYVLTARPAQNKIDITVDLPRPRHKDLILDPQFIRLKEIIMNNLTSAL